MPVSPLKVVYLHQYYRKPKDGGAIRSYYLSKALVDAGSEVEIVTSHNNPNYRNEVIDGVTVHFLPVKYDNRFSNLRRKLSFLVFFVKSYFFIRKNVKDADICYASSTPLTVGLTAVLLKKFQKIPFYFEVRDLWPEAPIQMGALRNPLLKSLLRWMERFIYRNAEKIIALSPGMKQGIDDLGFAKKTSMLPNISDCEYFKLEDKTVKNTFYYGVGGKFVITYFGAIGKVNNIDFILNLAKETMKQGMDDIVFLIAGKGSELRNLRSASQQMKLKNVRFLGFQNRGEIKNLLNVTDASIVTFRDKKILETNSPNKFFDSIASGKLCIVNNKGWVKELIEHNECGFYLNPKIGIEFTEKIQPYLSDPELLKQTKVNARKLAETQFARKKLIKQFTQLFDLPSRSNNAKANVGATKSKSKARA